MALDVNVRSLIERLERFNDFAAAIEDFASQIGLPAGDVQRECLRNLTPIAGAGLFDPRLNFEMDTGGGCVAGPLRRQQVDADGRPGAIMGKQKIKREGPGFLVYTSKPKARRGVLQTFSQLTNQRASTQLMVRYTTADQFPGYLSKRLEITTLLARYTLYFRFVWLPGPASVYVSGAAAQVGTGTSTTPTRGADGGVVYNGLDASHVRLGTYTVNGDAVSLSWPARIFELAKRRGVPRGQISEVFPANVSMASVAMMYDAVTDYTDALLNRVFGKVEDYTHQAMRVLVPPTTPANAAELEQYQIRFTEAFPSLVAKMMKRYARLRLRQLAAADAKQASQAVPADGTVPMFRRESDILKAMMMQLDDARSETMAALDAMVARARGDIRDEVADAVAARVEVTGPSSV